MAPGHQVSEDSEDGAIARALTILRSRLERRRKVATVGAVKDYLRLQAAGLAHEVFAVMYLDAANRLIDYEQVFRGTLTRSAVYPREILKQAVLKGAASVILHHNHPSGCCLPSTPDTALTLHLREILGLVEVRVLDHIITSDEGAFSMAENGLMP